MIGRDELDLAYLGPAPYVEMTKKFGRKPLLARQVVHGSPLFHGKIFVRKDSPIQSLADMAGKRFVFGDPRSTMSSLVPQYMLWQAGVTVDKLAGYKHVKDHVNATLAVLAGEFDAGAVKEDVFFEHEARGLRAVATSPGISDHLFVARSNLPPEKVGLIREAMLTILEEPDGSAIVGAITPGVTNLIQVEDRHYDNLRAILDKLAELGVAH
jgi:phosphonate transport system substrate-binding protein